jgi:low affinity Fe/Cu permease
MPKAHHKERSAMNELFRKFAHTMSEAVGTPWAFILAIVVIVAWAVTGNFFNYSDTWQLVINTGTTIVTFLMVFLIQNTQNRDSKAIHLKLDELIRCVKGARDEMVNLENFSDEDLKRLQEEFVNLVEHSPINRTKRAIDEELGGREVARKRTTVKG